MSKEKNKLPNKNNVKALLDCNGDPIDPNREYIGDKIKVPMASPNSSIYKTSSTIILRGKQITEKQKKEAKFLKFLSRAPISFDEGDNS